MRIILDIAYDLCVLVYYCLLPLAYINVWNFCDNYKSLSILPHLNVAFLLSQD